MDKVFDIELPPTAFKAKVIILLLYVWKKMFPKTRLCCLKPTRYNSQAVVYNAFKTDKRFYENFGDNWLRFRPIDLGERNLRIEEEMKACNSVALHVRRGDYLSPGYAPVLSGIATEEYYTKAVDIAKSRIENATFYVFSDDIDWCKTHLGLDNNATYVDWNTGKRSFIDMYLMTKAKANIIANSTFSYWGAYLNNNALLVVYPHKWINGEWPDIFPDDWIGL